MLQIATNLYSIGKMELNHIKQTKKTLLRICIYQCDAEHITVYPRLLIEIFGTVIVFLK